jgi:NAD(P)-dependent dehydrogenase (short-subunit alcohol dehydrogenase family)
LAVISGRASGLGRAVAECVVVAGGKAAIPDLQDATSTNAAQEIGASFFKCDLSVEAEVNS